MSTESNAPAFLATVATTVRPFPQTTPVLDGAPCLALEKRPHNRIARESECRAACIDRRNFCRRDPRFVCARWLEPSPGYSSAARVPMSIPLAFYALQTEIIFPPHAFAIGIRGGAVRHIKVTSAGVSPYAALTRSLMLCSNPSASAAWAWAGTMLRACSSRNAASAAAENKAGNWRATIHLVAPGESCSINAQREFASFVCLPSQ